MGASVVLSIYSGRPNPMWQLDAAAENDCVRRLASLSTTAPSVTLRRPTLGYRGFTIDLISDDSADRHIVVYGAVVREGKHIRYDAERAFERWLLETAPPELLEPSVLEHVHKAAGHP